MKRRTGSIGAFVLAALLAGSVSAGEAPKAAENKPEAKQEEEAFRGLLLAKPKDAPENVIASFVVFPKKFEIVDERKAVHLFAKGDVAKQIADLSRERTKVEILGVSGANGITVSKIEVYTGKSKLKREKEQEANAVKAKEVSPPAQGTSKPKLPRGDEEF
ncbi:MAG TPA: hypothetical protein VEK08_03430 [Planctomycetota bacterium]|nr:hypothetical protein [Planctomycetota bacterium]